MRLIVDLSTEYLRDTFCIPVDDHSILVKDVVTDLRTRYNEWHSFKIYDLDLFKNRDSCGGKKSDKLLDYLGLSAKPCRETKIRCLARESEYSIERRAEDARKAEEERRAREAEKRRKEKERKKKVKKLKLSGNCWQLKNTLSI